MIQLSGIIPKQLLPACSYKSSDMNFCVNYYSISSEDEKLAVETADINLIIQYSENSAIIKKIYDTQTNSIDELDDACMCIKKKVHPNSISLKKDNKSPSENLSKQLIDAAKYNIQSQLNALICQKKIENFNQTFSEEQGRSILVIAAKHGSTDCVRILIAHRASPHLEDKGKKTALTYAVMNGHVECTKMLLESSAKIGTKDNYYQKTPLIYAVQKERFECMKLLLKYAKKTDIEARDYYGRSALDYAQKLKDKRYAEAILSKLNPE